MAAAMEGTIDLSVAKKNLSEALGDNMKLYLQNLKSWFKQKMTKEEFDLEARRLFDPEQVHLHNDFLLSIITKCQSLTSSLVPYDTPIIPTLPKSGKLVKKNLLRKKTSSSQNTSQQRFVSANPMQYALEDNCRAIDDEMNGGGPVNYNDACLKGFATRELTLPDISMIHGRMFVCAWDVGLDNVADNTVKIILIAVKLHLKNIISSTLSRRNGFKLREKRFKFGMGTDVSNPYIRQTSLVQDPATESLSTTISSAGCHLPRVKPSYDIGEEEAVHKIATATELRPSCRNAVSLYDLLETLKMQRSVIPSHTVYAPAIEKIIHKLWHPSQDELDQESIHQQETRIKQQVAARNAAIT